MSLAILERQLQLLRFLARNSRLNVDEVAVRMGFSRRQVYRYIEVFRQAGLEFENHGSVYHLLPSSPLVDDLSQAAYLSPDEARIVYQMLNLLPTPNARVRGIKGRLAHAYSRAHLPEEDIDIKGEHNLQQILRAIENRHQVVLHRYHSHNSDTITDRLVEPYCLVNGGSDVRCYELASQQSKSFRLTRMEQVEILPQEWQNEDCHTLPDTDPFGYFSNEEQQVQLLMTARAFQLYCEEVDPHPQYEEGRPDGRIILHTSYCHPAGIGRFILGLPGEVEVVGDEALSNYLAEQIKKFIK